MNRYSGVANLRNCINPSSIKLIINKPAPGVAIHIDEISVTNYKRDRSWRVAADQEKILRFSEIVR